MIKFEGEHGAVILRDWAIQSLFSVEDCDDGVALIRLTKGEEYRVRCSAEEALRRLEEAEAKHYEEREKKLADLTYIYVPPTDFVRKGQEAGDE